MGNKKNEGKEQKRMKIWRREVKIIKVEKKVKIGRKEWYNLEDKANERWYILIFKDSRITH